MSTNSKPVIRSLEENDAYKDTMRQVFLHRYPAATACYELFCRGTPQYPLAELRADVERELDHLCSLTYSDEALDHKRSLRYMQSDYVDFLALFRYQRRFISVWTEGERLCVRAQGPQVHVAGFEIHVLNIVGELYFRRFDVEALLQEGRRRLQAKIAMLHAFRRENTLKHPLHFFDFGLRRRFSAAWHDEVVETLLREVPDFFKGTSNVYLARRHGIAPIGSMAHDYLQSYQAKGGRLRDFQKAAFEDWVHAYRGETGIALTDVIGMDAFIADFDLYFAKLFDGLRHDSGDPFVWGEKAIAMYRDLRIPPDTKRLTWSDGLNMEKMFALHRAFGDRTRTGFGIGTNLTNDLGVPALDLVMKLVACNGQAVAKLSDSPGKTLCTDETFLAYLRQQFNHGVPPAVDRH